MVVVTGMASGMAKYEQRGDRAGIPRPAISGDVGTEAEDGGESTDAVFYARRWYREPRGQYDQIVVRTAKSSWCLRAKIEHVMCRTITYGCTSRYM